MTMTPSPTEPRTTEPICPSWCTGHNDALYQNWEDKGDGSHSRDHGGVETLIGGIMVAVQQCEDEKAGMAAPVVWIAENHPDVETHDLTPAQARELAAAIVAAADRIDSEASR